MVFLFFHQGNSRCHCSKVQDAVGAFALVERAEEAEVELLQDQRVVEAEQAGQRRQHLQGGLFDEEFGHRAGFSCVYRVAFADSPSAAAGVKSR